MKADLPFKKSVMMDKVFKELKEIISSLVVKLTCEADKYETVENRKAADQYILAMKHQDSFFSYETYSEYALNRIGIGNYYMADKRLIPNEYRDSLVVYQRDYVIKTFIEKNEYYRLLNGLPALSDKEYVYVTEITNEEIEGVDTTIPLHEMSNNEIIILNAMGYLEILQNNHPDKKYLNHLLNGTRIDIVKARTCNDYDILYIYSDRTKQPITEMFMTLYKQSRDYVLDRFYDSAYEYKNDYYGNYIGLFILTITVQRFITNYFHKFINRDFYDKDIIKLLFDSYDIPFYNDIPLTYSQKVAKNLNRLFYYKSTNKVFVDIFKIFDMDNIQVCNYIMFKNPKMDDSGKPVLIYNEKTEIGYQVETVTDILESNESFYGSYRKDYKNVKKILEVEFNNQFCKVILLSNGIINFDTNDDTEFHKTILNNKHSYDDYGKLQFDEYFNIKDIKLLIDNDRSTYAVFLCKQTNIIYTFKHNKIEKIDLKEKFSNINMTPTSILIKQDELSLNKVLIVNNKDNSYIYLKENTDDYIFNTELDEIVINGDYYDNAIALAMSSGKLFLYGDNKDYRLLNENSTHLTTFTEENDIIFSVKDVKILETGCVFILKNGTVRFSRLVPFFSDEKIGIHDTELVKKYKNIKGIFDLKDGDKILYFLITYSGELVFLNYSFSDKFGQLLFRADIDKPQSNYCNIRDINYINNGILITRYDTDSKICFSGLNEDKKFPFISTLNMITEDNELNVECVQILNGYYFFTTFDNKVGLYNENKITYITDRIGNEEIQNFISIENELFILVGKNYLFKISGNSPEDFKIEKIILDKIITYIFKPNKNDIIVSDIQNNKYILNKDKLIKIENFNIYDENENVYVSINKIDDKYYLEYQNEDNKIFKNILINDVIRIDRVTLIDNVLFLEGDKFYFIKLNEISDQYNDIDAYIHQNITTIRAKSDKILNNIIIYNRSGGISILKGFIHSDRLDAQITSDFISLFNDKNSNIRQIIFDKDNILLLKDNASYVTYEEALDEMYDLSFIEVPMDADNKAEYIADTQYHLDYDLVTNDDKLWGGDLDKKTFMKEILNNEYNYYTSKYISVNSTYDLIKLNFEVCYMFKMLTELKENEKYLTTNVKYVGDNVLIFDIVIALFALTCKKLGLEGNIIDTKTKSMTVLGFNFSLDYEYIDKIIKDHDLEHADPTFNKDKIKIMKPPAVFTNPAEEVNLYLENQQVMQDIYTYKYRSKTIQEYNAWKKIENASLYSKYTNEIYRISDNKIATSYLDYLKKKNPALYTLVNDADPDNLIEETDYLLLALSEYLTSDKFKYLFLNIPSLSMDSIRKFIYYLIDIFKSYTVDLKAMNIIYHIDDKRIHNIKMILEEENFKKVWCDYDKIKYIDFLEFTLENFVEFEKIKILIKENKESKFSYDEIQFLFSTYKTITEVIDEKRMSLIKDFSDFFSYIHGKEEINKSIKIIDEIEYSYIKPIIEKYFFRDIEFFGDANLSDYDKVKFKEYLIQETSIENFDKLIMIDLIDYYTNKGIFNDSERIKLTDLINQNTLNISNKNILGDTCDFIGLSSVQNKNNRINLKDIYHFIRNN